MAQKKTSTAVSMAGGEGAATGSTPCELGGQEIPAALIRFRTTDTVTFDYYICKTAALLRVYLVRDLVPANRQLLSETEGEAKIHLILPALGQGRHLLYWAMRPVGPQWQTRAELAVNATYQFRFRKN